MLYFILKVFLRSFRWGIDFVVVMYTSWDIYCIYTLSQKKRYPYNNVNNLRTEVPIYSPFRATLGLPIWHISTNFGQYTLKTEDSGEFSARKGCATQWPSWEISMWVTKSHCRPIVVFHEVALWHFVLSALAYLSQTADIPVVDLRGEGTAAPPVPLTLIFLPC